ncbi:unnamed protein product [Owenia fusiformis]|uniref:Uncharacterized protein n=1 Tax=Owenia fusiformis TaxID=6347 RepID=A0A8J1U9Y3_OWEFU|nr:unnamed protein product [Owenia fusiformis]
MEVYSEKYSEFTGFVDILGGKYVDRLDEKSKKKAKEEIYEDPKERDAAIRQFRDWVKAQPHYTVCTDDTFLLAFLRRCKYSQLEARLMFDTFHTVIASKIRAWMIDIKCSAEDLAMAHLRRCAIPLPLRDPWGRRIILWRAGAFDTGKNTGYNADTFFMMWGIILMILQREDMTQVNGYVILQDGTGQTMKHMTYFGLERFKYTLKLFYNNFPARIKKVVYYNCGMIMEAFMAIVSPLITQKIRDRFVVRGSMEEIYTKDIPAECLPLEYLPDDYKGKSPGNLEKVHGIFWNKVKEPAIETKIWDLSHNFFKVDEKKRPDADIPQAAFRKLNID